MTRYDCELTKCCPSVCICNHFFIAPLGRDFTGYMLCMLKRLEDCQDFVACSICSNAEFRLIFAFSTFDNPLRYVVFSDTTTRCSGASTTVWTTSATPLHLSSTLYTMSRNGSRYCQPLTVLSVSRFDCFALLEICSKFKAVLRWKSLSYNTEL